MRLSLRVTEASSVRLTVSLVSVKPGQGHFAIETNQFQEHLADQLESQCLRQGMRIRLLKINHGGDKVARIQSLEPLVNTGMLVFNRKHRLLIDQLRQFPRAAHDDGPDALEMAVEAAQPEPRPWIKVIY